LIYVRRHAFFCFEMTPRASTTLITLGLVLAALGGQWLLGADSAKTENTPAEKPAASSPQTRGIVPPHRPVGTQPSVATGIVNHHGEAVGVACMTCHTTREPNRENGLSGVTPKEFHKGLVYAHADLSCLSCHHADDYDSLRLADGRKLAFNQAQNLCAQCHGPQTRDYLHGSHGGMKGYWDKTKGGRTRNTCTDCHDPHSPAYPAWTPVFPPRDAAARQQAEREAKKPSSH
jgi:hypothetical protein